MKRIKRTLTGGGVYQKTTLPSGIRVVSECISGIRSISVGVWVDVGSRHESPPESGLSHYIEHMVFKGTKHRSARQIADSLESIGGSLNAFTTRENTCFTARILDEHLPQAMDVLADITCHPTISRTNLIREGMVICEEIKESLDNPADHVHDLFAQTFWGEQPLGQPIMGTIDNIRQMTRRQMLNYKEQHYRSRSVIVAAAGAVSHRKLERLTRDLFSFPEADPTQPEAAVYRDGQNRYVESNDTAQTHLCLGFPGFAYAAPKRMALMVLNTYFGGGMSSVLFQKVREQKGLAYSIYSYPDFYRDSGLFGIYLSTDAARLKQAYEIVLTECRRMKRRKLTSSALDKVKAQIKGHMMLGLESTSNRMHRLGRMELMMERFQPLRETIREIEKVTPGEVSETANLLFDENRLAVTVLGPVDESAVN